MAKYKPETLSQEQLDVIQHFKAQQIAHAKLQDVLTTIIDGIRSKVAPILLVIGPTGVGKTTLLLNVYDQLASIALTDPAWHVGRIVAPIVNLDHGDHPFSWRTFQGDLARSLYDPFLGKHVNYQFPEGVRPDREARLVITRAATEDGLKNANIDALEARQPYAILLDEGNHLLKDRIHRAYEQLNTLKSFSNKSKTIIVVFGTFELLELLQAKGGAQLIRRTKVIRFDRYFYTPEDLKEFSLVIGTLQAKLDVSADATLTDNLEFIFERTLGNIGLLKHWMSDWLISMYKHQEDELKYERFISTAYSPSAMLRFLDDFQLGERRLDEYLNEDEDTLKKLQARLGAINQHHKLKTAHQEKTPKPGTRKPTRDPVKGDD